MNITTRKQEKEQSALQAKKKVQGMGVWKRAFCI